MEPRPVLRERQVLNHLAHPTPYIYQPSVTETDMYNFFLKRILKSLLYGFILLFDNNVQYRWSALLFSLMQSDWYHW